MLLLLCSKLCLSLKHSEVNSVIPTHCGLGRQVMFLALHQQSRVCIHKMSLSAVFPYLHDVKQYRCRISSYPLYWMSRVTLSKQYGCYFGTKKKQTDLQYKNGKVTEL